jgi:hypothetical protein
MLAPLADVTAAFGITDWDLLLVGDASGSGWGMGTGWAVTAVDRHANGRKLLRGAWSAGTIMIAELMPYLHALAWYEEVFAPARRTQLGRAVLDVHVICDNENVVNQGNHHSARKKMLPWWACWAGLLRCGYRAQFHWVSGHKVGRRLGLNVLCDHVAGKAREAMEAEPPTFPHRFRAAASVYEINPHVPEGPCTSTGSPTTPTTQTGSGPTTGP